jgi:TolB-like protein/Tfp pilus assembly protein PilF
MSAEPSRAVFLSYASQDADVAEKICAALRAKGIEVWFDRSELVGGDSWDQKIRGQIGSCALFVPLISANTQARLEGYFRLEWKLAAQRTHTMADEKTFLLPVVIDATRDADAKVPAEFKTVQWTKLPAGETPEKFCARVKTLLGGSEGERASRPVGSEGTGQETRAPAKRDPSRSWSVPAIVGVGLLVAVAAFLALRPRRSPEEIAKLLASAPTIAADTAAKPAAALPALTEAQKLVEQARHVLETSDELNRENLYLVEDLAKRSLALEPANPDAWLISARVSYSLVWLLIDNSAQRRELVLQQAKRAVTLAPGSGAARLALINAQSEISYAYSGTLVGSDLEREARALVDAEPQNWRAHRALGTLLRALNHWDEAVVEHRKAYELSHDHPSSAADLINVLVRRRLFAEADEVRARAMSNDPAGRLLCWDAMLKLRWHGDAAAAREAVKTWPSWLSQEDRGLFQTWQTWMWSRQPESALRTARVAVRDLARDFSFYGPVAVLRAQANELAGNVEAAKADWQTALDRAERELAAEPDNEPGLYWKAWALARLGRVAEAKSLVSILAQRNQREVSAFFKATYLEPLQLLVGEKQLALTGLRRRLTASDDTIGLTRAMLELDPAYDAVRADPEFQAIVRDAPAPRAPSSTHPEGKSVAVLAFADLSAARDSEYFSDGISEELLNVLAKVPGLKVTARTSAFFFKGKNLPIPEIAQKLGVAYVIEGSVQRAGERVKITAQLIKAADGFHVWSDTFTREAKDVFAVEEEIAGLIAKQLSLKLGASSAAATASVNPQAFELYVQARQAWNRRNLADYDRAEGLLNRALELEPNFARAHAALADVWLTRGDDGVLSNFGGRNSANQSRIKAKAEQAVALDPESAEAHASLGSALSDWWSFGEAERELRKAISLNPNYASAHQWLARLLAANGFVAESLIEHERAVESDPLSSRILDNYASQLWAAGRFSEALAADDRAIALQPDNWQAVWGKARTLAQLGRYEEAFANLDRAPRDDRHVLSVKTRILALAGRRAEAESLMARMSGLLSVTAQALTLVALGRNSEALEGLDASKMTWSSINNVLFDSVLDPIRDEPRFTKFLATLGLTEAHARAQAWRKAHPPEKPAAK